MPGTRTTAHILRRQQCASGWSSPFHPRARISRWGHRRSMAVVGGSSVIPAKECTSTIPLTVIPISLLLIQIHLVSFNRSPRLLHCALLNQNHSPAARVSTFVTCGSYLDNSCTSENISITTPGQPKHNSDHILSTMRCSPRPP
ncbi:hypothetical protein VTO42DRAFT_3208 [Malbranchea cinnamomea]